MKLSVKAFAITAAILWGFALMLVGSANLIWPAYGAEFLNVVSSIYPGYETGTGVTGIVVSSLYGVVDAGIAGTIFAWLYNFLAKN
jgi:hypothetical protein